MKKYQVLVEFTTAAWIEMEASDDQDLRDQLDNPNMDLNPDYLEMSFCDQGHDRHICEIEEVAQ